MYFLIIISYNFNAKGSFFNAKRILTIFTTVSFYFTKQIPDAKLFTMRLKDSEKVRIKKVVLEFDPDSRVFLFGSRVDDGKKGGDIDLIVITNRNSFLDRVYLTIKLKETLGDQKIDLVLTDGKADPFVDMIKENAILI